MSASARRDLTGCERDALQLALVIEFTGYHYNCILFMSSTYIPIPLPKLGVLLVLLRSPQCSRHPSGELR